MGAIAARARAPRFCRLSVRALIAVALFAFPAFGGGATAEEPAALERLTPEGQGTVVEVVDGDTVILDDGREVRLVGTQAPKLPLGRPDFVAWPLSDEAKAHLEDLILSRAVSLHAGGQAMDRHGRHLAHLVRIDDGLWVQGQMLADGMARVYTFPDNRALAAAMYDRERAARAAGDGIWADPYYAVRSPDQTNGDIGSFQVVRGLVVEAAEVRGRIYLNFGQDWRSDFTVTVAPRDTEVFEAAGLDLLGLEGQTIQVRGWVDRYNGPQIVATHPEQIEVCGAGC